MRTILVISSFILLGTAFADEETDSGETEQATYITDITVAKKLYVYDDDFLELGELKKAAVEKNFKPIPGKDKSGIRIHQKDVQEGLVQVSLEQYPDRRVWLETMAVTIYPSHHRLDCPENAAGQKITQGQQTVATLAMTIGFGEHCENVDASAEDVAQQ